MRDRRPAGVRRRTRPGFTLVELLTVIAIIAILAAIIFPVMSTVRRNVYKAQCTSNLHAIAQALKLYKDDYRVYPEALYGYVVPAAQQERTFLYPQYIKEKESFRCPIAPDRTNSTVLLPAAHPVTGRPIIDPFFSALSGGKEVPVSFWAWDSYDGSRVPHPGGPYQIHYVKKWTPGRPTFNDNPRQLIYRNPPDSTVVTWCTYHRSYVGGQPEQGSIDLVLFLDGHVAPIPSDRMLPLGGDPTRPYMTTYSPQ